MLYAKARIAAGLVKDFAGTTAPPGWLPCDGATYSRTTYAALFAAIGTIHGAGDGATTFAVPDLRDDFVRGASSTRPVGTRATDSIRSHTHTENQLGQTGVGAYGTVVGGADVPSWTNVITNTGASGGSETAPRFVALLKCIKY